MKGAAWWIAFVLVVIVLIPLHGYLYTSSLLNKQAELCGAYPSVDEAILANILHNNYNPIWFEDYIKSQNSEHVPWTWYVVKKIRPEYSDEFQQTPKPEHFCGGSFYHLTKHGWVGMPENYWNGTGLMDFWMWVFQLYQA